MVSGPLATMIPDPVVIWKDGEFVVVPVAGEDDTVIDVDFKRPPASVARIEKIIAARAVKLETLAEQAETPEQVAEVVEEIVAEELAIEEPVVEEEPKPAPKKRATRKKTSSTDE